MSTALLSDCMEIIIEPRTLPVCECGGTEWIVVQRMKQQALLLRVDGLADLLTEKPDPTTFQQLIWITCTQCGEKYTPQDGVEAWFEGGGEDGFGWPTRVTNHGEEE